MFGRVLARVAEVLVTAPVYATEVAECLSETPERKGCRPTAPALFRLEVSVRVEDRTVPELWDERDSDDLSGV